MREITRLNAPVDYTFHTVRAEQNRVAFSPELVYIQTPHDVVISLDNALWDVSSAQCHRRVD